MKEEMPSNELWVAELIYGWKNRLTLARVLINVNGLQFTKFVSPAMLLEMSKRATKYNPPLKEFCYLSQQVTSWMATHYVKTSELLWQGKIPQAVKMLVSKKDYSRETMGSAVRKEIRRDEKDIKASITIKARSLSNTDWSKCK